MPIIEIKDFAKGLDTQSDSEDSGKFTTFQNWEIDKDGLLYKRDFLGSASTVSSMTAYRGYRWMDINDGGDDYWVFIGENNSTPYIYHGTSLSGLLTTDATATTDTQIIPFNNKIRFANGRDTKPRLYQYLDRDFFFGNYQPTVEIIKSNSELSYPSTWTYSSITTQDNGNNAIGHYYYKFVPVFDGQQECHFGDTFAYYNLTAADKILKITFDLDTGNFNSRITAIKVYRSYNASNIDPSYYHIKTIPLNSDSSHDDIKTQITGVDIARTVYFPNKSFTSYNGTQMSDLVLNGTYYTITGYGSDYITVDSNIASANSVWDGSWDVTDSDDNSTTSGSTGAYGGANVLYKSNWGWKNDELLDWVANITSGNDTVVIANMTKAVKLNRDSGIYGTNNTVDLTDGYKYTYSSPDLTLDFYDYGLLDGSPHPLGGKDKISVNYGCGDYLNGRFFVGNVKLDPDGEAEVHRDWIIYSEYLQPDVLPIDNYIQIKDAQGGEIKAIKAYNGDLVVFGERGVFRLQVPSLDPSGWQLTEAEKNVNIVSPDSITEVEGMMFFAAKDNVYVITPNFQVYPVANDIKDGYQAISDLSNSRFVYDVKKQRLLCSFTEGNDNIYVLDLRAFMTNGATVWTQIIVTGAQADIILKDENNIIYSGYHNGTATQFNQLYGSSGGETTVTPVFKTGHIKLSDMKKPAMIRRMNISYKSGDAIRAYFYIDKSTSYTNFYNQNTSGQTYVEFPVSTNYTNKSYRIGKRARFLQLFLLTNPNTSAAVEISKIEFEIE